MAHIAGAFGFSTSTASGGNLSGTTTVDTTVKSFTYTPTTAGNLVLFWVTQVPTSTSPTTCVLSATGWTFTQLGGIVNGGTSAGCAAMFWAYAPNTSLATITMTWNQPTNSWFQDMIDEFSGAGSSSPIAGFNSATGSGTPSVSVTPTSNNCTIWLACNDSVTAVGNIGGSAATKGNDDANSDWTEYRLLSGGSGVAQTCAIGGSSSYIVGAVAITPAVAPTIGSVPSGTALSTPAFTAKFLFFDTGDYSPGV